MPNSRKLPLFFAVFALVFLVSGLVVWQTIRWNKEEVVIIEASRSQDSKKSEKSAKSVKSAESVPQEPPSPISENPEQQEQILGESDIEFGKLSVNEATEEELDTVPGVGTATIKKIIDGRPWENLEDALNLINKRWREEARGKLKL